MCGRFDRHQPLTVWAAALHGSVSTELFDDLSRRDNGARYNIAPGTKAWIAALGQHGGMAFHEHKWIFPTSRGNRINVRSETAHVVPEYREYFDHHRCVALADGFYEPEGRKTGGNRPWFYFRSADGLPLFLGAVAKADGFSILTRKPVDPVASVHDRSPVMIPADDVLAWLDPEIPGRDALTRFAPADHGELLQGWRVGDGAKRPVNEGPGLIAPVNELLPM